MNTKNNHDISQFSAFKTKATAAYFVEVTNKNDLKELSSLWNEFVSKKLPILVLGAGTNCLFAFDHFPGLVVYLQIRGVEFESNDTVRMYSSELVSPHSIAFTRDGRTNAFVPWIGLPGTFGGAIVGNAGCFGLETKDILLSAEIFDCISGEFLDISVDNLDYSYRNSILKTKRNWIVVSGLFDTRPRNENPFAQKNPVEMLAIRREKQPAGLSCGSFYANPPGESAGRLIDQAGCKGMKIGGARISEHHGNFFLVDSSVVYSDIIELSNLVKDTVFKKFGIKLHEEVRIITL